MSAVSSLIDGKTIRTQILVVFIITCFSGLGMTFMFMTTINGRISDIDKKVDRIEQKQERFIEKFIEK